MGKRPRTINLSGGVRAFLLRGPGLVLEKTTPPQFLIALNLGKSLIPVKVSRSARKSMVLALGPEGSPELKIPKHCSPEEANRFLKKNQDWLVELLRQKFLQSHRENK